MTKFSVRRRAMRGDVSPADPSTATGFTWSARPRGRGAVQARRAKPKGRAVRRGRQAAPAVAERGEGRATTRLTESFGTNTARLTQTTAPLISIR
jgi:hypothetical protein